MPRRDGIAVYFDFQRLVRGAVQKVSVRLQRSKRQRSRICFGNLIHADFVLSFGQIFNQNVFILGFVLRQIDDTLFGRSFVVDQHAYPRRLTDAPRYDSRAEFRPVEVHFETARGIIAVDRVFVYERPAEPFHERFLAVQRLVFGRVDKNTALRGNLFACVRRRNGNRRDFRFAQSETAHLPVCRN